MTCAERAPKSQRSAAESFRINVGFDLPAGKRWNANFFAATGMPGSGQLARASPVGFDLLLSYGVIGLFGMAVVIIGSRVQVRGQGTGLALLLAEQLAASPGISGKWIFLVGF